MWQDPIVMEVRALREQYAGQFNHDTDAIFQDILRRQAASGKKRASFPPRPPLVGSLSPAPAGPGGSCGDALVRDSSLPGA